MAPQRLTLILTGVFVLLLGLAQLFALPPFEGIDEHGHFSMIRQFATQGFVYEPTKIYIDKTYADYKMRAPTFYSVLEPYDQNGGMTYRQFFERPDLVEPYRKLYREQSFAEPYAESQTLNWQQQHPPLYYLALAGVQKMIGGFSFVEQFFALRFVSYLLAFAGYMIGFWGSLRYSDPKLHGQIAASFALYPILFLQFTPEFARLGNDSLCLLLTGIAWALFLRGKKNPQGWRGSLLFGFVLGLGLLTKAFFLPIAAGYFAYCLAVMFKERKDRRQPSMRFDHLVFVGLPVIVFGFWYIFKWRSTGVFLGHYEYNIAADHGLGLIQNFIGKNNFRTVVLSAFGIFVTTTWAGTFSQPRFVDLFHLPYLFFAGWVIVRSYMAVKTKPLDHPVWLFHWVFAFFMVGILHHSVVVMSVDNASATPGWYLHILAPLIAFFLSFGLAEIAKDQTARVLMALMVPYTLYFFVAVMWQELIVYSGCATQIVNKSLTYYDNAYCLTKVPDVFEKVGLLAWPGVAVGVFVLGVLIFVGTLIFLRRKGA